MTTQQVPVPKVKTSTQDKSITDPESTDVAYDAEELNQNIDQLLKVSISVIRCLIETDSIKHRQYYKDILDRTIKFCQIFDHIRGNMEEKLERIIYDLFKQFFLDNKAKMLSKNNIEGYNDDLWLRGTIKYEERKIADYHKLVIGSNQGKPKETHLPISEIYGCALLVRYIYKNNGSGNIDKDDPEYNKTMYPNYFLRSLYGIFYSWKWDNITTSQIFKVISQINARLGFSNKEEMVKNVHGVVSRLPDVADMISQAFGTKNNKKINELLKMSKTVLGSEKTSGILSDLATDFVGTKELDLVHIANVLIDKANDKEFNKKINKVYREETGEDFKEAMKRFKEMEDDQSDSDSD